MTPRWKHVPALLAVVVLAACGVTEGTIYDKSYEKAHYESRSRPIYHTQCVPVTKTQTTYVNGQPQTRTYTTTECHQVWVGTDHYRVWIEDKWCLYFRNKDGDKGHKCVNEEAYNFYDEGDYFKPSEDDNR